jgi:hypothetical protein
MTDAPTGRKERAVHVDLRMKSIALTSFPLSPAFLVDLNRHFVRPTITAQNTEEEVLRAFKSIQFCVIYPINVS